MHKRIVGTLKALQGQGYNDRQAYLLTRYEVKLAKIGLESDDLHKYSLLNIEYFVSRKNVNKTTEKILKRDYKEALKYFKGDKLWNH